MVGLVGIVGRVSKAVPQRPQSAGREDPRAQRHGKEVARLVPAKSGFNREEAHAAVRRIRERAEELKLGPFDWSEWKAFRDEGRP